MVKTDQNKYQMTLIAPKKGMHDIFSKIADILNINIHIIMNGEENAVDIVRNISPDKCEAILARRFVAGNLKSYTDIPIVSIELNTLDLLRILQPYTGRVHKVALIRADSPLLGVNYVGHALQMDIQQHIYNTQAELQQSIDLLDHDVDLIIGGILAYNYAVPLGFSTINIVDEEEIARRSMNDAIELARARRKERQWDIRLETLMNSIGEGIIVLDENGNVRRTNAAAERLLKCRHDSIRNTSILNIMPDVFTQSELSAKTAVNARVQEVQGRTLVVNRVPILFQGKNMGAVCTLSDARHIQQAADNVRQKLKTRGFTTRYTFEDIQTNSPAMRRIKNLGRLYAPTDASLLLTGESGTGKEVFAQSIHAESRRKDSPFVAVNCAAIPEGLLESELFGYESGAFTGARRQGKAGMFELAHTGTLLLDEVSDLPLSLQGRLLRVLQEKELIRVGGTQIVPLDVRVICASSEDLCRNVEQGTFRPDLYYRINVLALTIPPLRERPEDILGIAVPYLLERLDRPPMANTLKEQIGPLLLRHRWPGNIRELQSTLERLVIVANCATDVPDWAALLSSLWTPAPCTFETSLRPPDTTPPDSSVTQTMSFGAPLKDQIRSIERAIVEKTLRHYDQDIGKTAKSLGISRMTLWRKLTDDI